MNLPKFPGDGLGWSVVFRSARLHPALAVSIRMDQPTPSQSQSRVKISRAGTPSVTFEAPRLEFQVTAGLTSGG
jgi:hypothetical protein